MGSRTLGAPRSGLQKDAANSGLMGKVQEVLEAAGAEIPEVDGSASFMGKFALTEKPAPDKAASSMENLDYEALRVMGVKLVTMRDSCNVSPGVQSATATKITSQYSKAPNQALPDPQLAAMMLDYEKL